MSDAPPYFKPEAAEILRRALSVCVPADRSAFLHDMLRHTAAGIELIDGRVEASEAVYRLGDAVVGGLVHSRIGDIER